MPIRTVFILKASLIRHPLAWTLGLIGMGIALGALAIYHSGFRSGVVQATPQRLVTEDGREYNLYIPPRIGLTGRPIMGLTLGAGAIRPTIGAEVGRIHPLNFDLLLTIPIKEEDVLDWGRTSIGPGAALELTLNTSAGVTAQWEPKTDHTWIAAYIRWRF